MKWQLNKVMTIYFFLAAGNAKETNPYTETQSCEEEKQLEVDEVDEFMDNTSGHSEFNVNVQTCEKLVEEYEEREENKTALGIYKIYICMIRKPYDHVLSWYIHVCVFVVLLITRIIVQCGTRMTSCF